MDVAAIVESKVDVIDYIFKKEIVFEVVVGSDWSVYSYNYWYIGLVF